MKPIDPARGLLWKAAIVLICLAAGVWFVSTHQADLNREKLIEFGKGLPAVWLVVLFFLLPLFGFPVSVFLVLAGIRFGFAGGMAVSAAALFFHNLAAYHLAQGLFRSRVSRFLERVGYSIPPIRETRRGWYTALFAAVHGVPYVAKLYLLALTDIPFRTYFWVGSPVYIISAALPVAIGSAVAHLDMFWTFVIATGLTVIPIGLYFLLRRFNRTETERF